jgi:hypothetical protein
MGLVRFHAAAGLVGPGPNGGALDGLTALPTGPGPAKPFQQAAVFWGRRRASRGKVWSWIVRQLFKYTPADLG